MNASIELLREFWERMATNDFRSAAELLADGYVLDWPQSNERIRGREAFARVNEEYPAHGPWTFEVNRLFGNQHEVVSDVLVSDGVQRARAITFSTVRDGRIVSQVEFWPEEYAAPANRRHLVEAIRR